MRIRYFAMSTSRRVEPGCGPAYFYDESNASGIDSRGNNLDPSPPGRARTCTASCKGLVPEAWQLQRRGIGRRPTAMPSTLSPVSVRVAVVAGLRSPTFTAHPHLAPLCVIHEGAVPVKFPTLWALRLFVLSL